jgi:Clp amino terminal domain, pathogenicity island component
MFKMAQEMGSAPWTGVLLAWIAGILSALCLAELWRWPHRTFWTVLVLLPFLGPLLFVAFRPRPLGSGSNDKNFIVPEYPSNFTPMAQEVLNLAHTEASRLHHHFVGTEHLLLGLLKLGRGVAVNVLQKMDLKLDAVRMEIENLVGTGPDEGNTAKIPCTPRTKRVYSLAVNEAKALNHTYVGTEHILLGLLQEGDGVAARVLQNLGVDIDRTRQEVLKELNPNSDNGQK